MEPRPNQKPARGSASPGPDASAPSSGNPVHSGGETTRWSTTAWTSPSNPPPNPPSTPRAEPAPVRASEWRGQPGLYAPETDNGYSPGPSLAPIDHGRGSSWIGPLVAVVVLALIVAAVAVAFTKVRGGDSGANNPPNQTAGLAAPALTSTAHAGLQTQITATAAPSSPTTQAAAVAAAQAKPSKQPTKAPQPTDTPQKSSSSGGGSVSAAGKYLPSVSEVGSGFAVTEDGTRTRTQVAGTFGDPAAAEAKLKQWGWKENAYRTFEIPADKVTDPSATVYINVSVHHFSSGANTASAFAYFTDAVVAAPGMTEVTVDKIGDQTRELTSTSAAANVAVLYIRHGNYLIRLGGSSATGDSSADLIALAKKILG